MNQSDGCLKFGNKNDKRDEYKYPKDKEDNIINIKGGFGLKFQLETKDGMSN